MFIGKDVVMIDIETNGLDEKKDKIIFYKAMIMPYLGETYFKYGYGNPGREIEAYITNLTHVTNEDVKDAISSEKLKDEIIDLIKDKIVISPNRLFVEAFLGEKIETCLDINTFNLFELQKPKYKEYIKDLDNKFKDKENLKTSDIQAELRCDYKTAELFHEMLSKSR